MSDGPVQNTDRELWREREGDHYANSIHVTEGGSIGINVGGYVIVKPLAEWHKLAAPDGPPSIRTERASGLACYHIWRFDNPYCAKCGEKQFPTVSKY